jgi:site-specific recombinase XerD
MTPRVQEALTARKDLGADKFVFGAESGAYVASFDKSWRELFKHAGLPVGRRNGLTWHDLRHEFVSHLVGEGGEIHEVKEAVRHKDIRTTERYRTAREDRVRGADGEDGQQGSRLGTL